MPGRGILSPCAENTPFGQQCAVGHTGFTVTATVAGANVAKFLPVYVPKAITVTDMLIAVATTGGNVDVGIYTWAGVRIVSSGAILTGAAGAQVLGIVDTLLQPGWYFLAISTSSATAIFRSSTGSVANLRVCGMQQMAAAHPLPATATFATYTSPLPYVCAAFRATA